MKTTCDHVLIIADIEGSSGCWNYRASSFMTDEWSRACVEMSRDVNAVVSALLDAGVKQVKVKDFHRTAHNLLPELIDPRSRVVAGYKRGPVPGIGDPGNAESAMFLGMHAASGTEGFLPHTLTSRFKGLTVNGRPLAEVQLFAASLAPFGVKPIFFSGCPVACAQAEEAIKGIQTYLIDKSPGQEAFNAELWRSGLARSAVASVLNSAAEPYEVEGPLKAVVTVRDGKKVARKLALRWGFVCEGPQILLEASDMHQLYGDLVKLCYLTPFTEKMLPAVLFLNNLKGRIGLSWVRRRQGHRLV
jgi:D-aminopeptidase